MPLASRYHVLPAATPLILYPPVTVETETGVPLIAAPPERAYVLYVFVITLPIPTGMV